MSESAREKLPEHLFQYRSFNSSGDTDFLFSSWLHSYRNATKEWPWFEKLGNELFYTTQKKRIEKVMEEATVLVICNPEDESQIFGYIVFEKNDRQFVLHYMYMKQSYRGFGLGKGVFASLFNPEEDQVVYTHLTNAGLSFLRSLGLKTKPVFNPYWRQL